MGIETGTAILLSAGFSGATALASGAAQSRAHKYNQAMSQQAAAEKRQVAAYQAEQKRKEDEKLMGRMRARMGSSGLDATSGSSLALLKTTAEDANRDYRQILRNGAVAANALEGEAGLQGMYASNAMTSGIMGAAGAVADGAFAYKAYTEK